MSATLDTNVLLYASDEASPLSGSARAFVQAITAGPDLVYLFWPAIMAYLRISTHPRLFEQPLTLPEALANIEELTALPHVRTPGEDDRFWSVFRPVAEEVQSRGKLVPDAHLVALMRQHGVGTIWTRDRDFRKFSRIVARDPFE